jgi:Domain of unknown function (DUF4118)
MSPSNLFGQYVASIAIAGMAALAIKDLPTQFLLLKYACFAAAVCWSFLRLRMGPAFCTLIIATLATDYYLIDPIFSLSLDKWTAAALTCYFALGLVVLKLNSLHHRKI